MEYSPQLQRQSSCSCPPLDVANWYSSRRIRMAGFSQRSGEEIDLDDFGALYYRPARATAGKRLRGLWRRIVKEKRRILSSRNQLHVPYDPYTYAQNFDEGSAWDVEPENLSRSFSARFAVPSSVWQRLG